MGKFSEMRDLMWADMMQNGAIHSRYWQSSSLPIVERQRLKPSPLKFRRDKVLRKLVNIEMKSIMDLVQNAKK